MFLVGQLSVAPPPPPLVLADFEQMLMVMFLRVNQHNYSHLLEGNSLRRFGSASEAGGGLHRGKLE